MDATGGPIAGARVRALRLQPPRISIDTKTDGEGRFALSLQAGLIELSAEAEGYARTSLRAAAPSQVELRLWPGASIEGTVVKAGTREPVAHVEVKAAPPDNPQLALARGAVTDGTGRFQIEGLDPGSYLLTARGSRALGMFPQSIDLAIAQHARDVVIEVAPAAEVSGRVLIENGAEPCREGWVALGDPDIAAPPPSADEVAAVHPDAPLTRATAPEQVAEIQSDGSVHFPGVPPGYYFTNVRCASHVLAGGPRVLHVRSEPVDCAAARASSARSASSSRPARAERARRTPRSHPVGCGRGVAGDRPLEARLR